jgi:hypothetical protein
MLALNYKNSKDFPEVLELLEPKIEGRLPCGLTVFSDGSAFFQDVAFKDAQEFLQEGKKLFTEKTWLLVLKEMLEELDSHSRSQY